VALAACDALHRRAAVCARAAHAVSPAVPVGARSDAGATRGSRGARAHQC
jgi:hypothetical protein